MYVPFNTSRPFFPPSYTPPLYTPIMTQPNFGPPLIRRIIIPTQINFDNPQFAPIPPIPRTPLIKISPPRYKPVMTEPSDNFRRPLNNESDESFKQINDTEFKTHSNHTHSDIPKPDLDIIERLYIKNQYSREFNRKLRMFGPMGLNEEDIKLYDALMGVINSHKTSENFLVHRFVKNDYLECVFNFKPSNIFFNLMMIRQHIGTRKVEKGFMSCYMTETHIVEGNIQLEIKIPKGTRAYITRNTIESEIILPCNTEYEITEASIKNNIIQINAIIINYDENNTDLKSSLLRIFT